MKKDAILQTNVIYIFLSILLAPFVSQAQVYQERYLAYDSFGKLTEVQDALGIKTAYDWSEDGTKIIGIFSNAQASNVFAHSFAHDGLEGWTFIDNGTDGDTEVSIYEGKLNIKNYASASSGEIDRIYYDHGTEITQSVIWEFNVKIVNSNSWNLQMNAGGSSWDTGYSSTERAIWSAITNESWRVHNGSNWVTLESNLTVGETYHFKIVIHPVSNTADYYLNGRLLNSGVPFMNSSSGVQKIAFGNYGYDWVTTEWLIDNVRMYPEAAQAVSQEADPLFGNALAMKDVAGSTNRFEYDEFGRLEKTYNPNGELVSSQVYYYSLDGNTSFNPADPNRVESWTHNDPSTPSNVTKSVSYLDGLGREIQTQQRGGNSTLITGTLYNERGLPEVSSRPVEKVNQTTYLSTLFDGSGTFTPGSALPGSSPIEDYYQESYAYSQSTYEDSPLGRALKSTLPGTAHKMDSGKEIETTYGLNTSESFTINGKNWSANTLNKVVTKDPDGNETITYTDGWGQTIVSGINMNSSSDDVLNKSTSDLVTYFEYDLRGNLVRVEDPRGLITTYDYTISAYNPKGQLVEKKHADQTHPHKFRYDKKGRLRFHRDPNQDAASDHYYYTKYDELDRPIETGSYNSSSGFDNITNINNPSWPTSGGRTPNIYYRYDGTGSYNGARNLKGRLTRTSYKDLDYGSWGYTWYSYNEFGLIEWVVQRLPALVGDLKIEYDYDELGRLKKMHFNPLSSSSEDHYFWYYYDNLGRLEKVTSYGSDISGSAITEAEYVYYADGQVQQLILGDGAQTLDYDYTVQGWLEYINDGSVSGGDAFGMFLDYNNNGNISQQQWTQSAATSTNILTYNYGYDEANRLTSSSFDDLSGSLDNFNGYDGSFSYDKSGNIKSLIRRYSGESNGYPYKSIPSVTYSTTSNRITNFSYQFGPVSAVNESVTYDANGNIKTNTQQGINATTYNWRNLPTTIYANGSRLTYTYDAEGNRIKKSIGPSIDWSTVIWYIRGADGQTIAAYDETGKLLFLNIIAGGQIIGQIEN